MTTLNDMTSLDHALDDAISRLAAGEDASSILTAYPSHADDLAPLLAVSTRLAPLQDAPDLAPERLAAGRRRMLEAAARRRQGGIAGAVARFGAAAQLRLTTGLRAHPLAAIVAALILVAVSAGGGAVAASSESLPGSPLYPVKLASEQVQILLAGDQQAQSDLKTLFEDRRQHEQEQLDRRQAAATPPSKGAAHTATAVLPSPAVATRTPSPDRDEDPGRTATATLGPSQTAEPDEPEKPAASRTPRATETPERKRTRTPESTPSVQGTPKSTPSLRTSPYPSRTPKASKTPAATRTPAPLATATPKADKDATVTPVASTSPQWPGGAVAPMLLTATLAMVDVVQARAAAINEIIDREGLAPKNIEELVTIFNEKET